MNSLRIGIDFDNTIVQYDEAFHKTALEKKLIPPSTLHSKNAVRDYLRRIGNENAWTELQGYIYGARMDLALPYPGIDRFLSHCHTKQIPVFIISHKTKQPFLGPAYDLHEAANNWLKAQSFFKPPPAFFELTLQEKLQRIKNQECTIFIDDLPELLNEPDFPPGVRKILFDPHRLHLRGSSFESVASWDELSEILFYA